MSDLGLFPEIGEPAEERSIGLAQETMIDGLFRLADFITKDEEQRLLSFIDRQAWRSDLKRRVQHYGFRYDYRARRVEPEDWLGPLPEAFRFIISRIMPKELFQVEPNQIIVNEYLPGQGIAPHIDCLPCFGETIVSLSLGSTCMMDFSKEGIQHKEHVVLEPRDLLILTGPARSTWRHGIAARKSDRINGVRRPRSRRVSLTLRVVVR